MPNRPVVLLVDDDPDTRELYQASLTHAGFRVVTAADAEAGFTVATSLRPAIVVADFRLRANGENLCNRLKHDDRTANVPIVLVTTSLERSNVEAALSQGCAIVRLKPYLPDALARDLRAIIAGKHLVRWPAEFFDASS